jgi:hypothetical protein
MSHASLAAELDDEERRGEPVVGGASAGSFTAAALVSRDEPTALCCRLHSDAMKREPVVPNRWILPLVVLGAFGVIPALWPVHDFGVFVASLVLRVMVSAILIYFIVQFFRRNGLRGPRTF